MPANSNAIPLGDPRGSNLNEEGKLVAAPAPDPVRDRTVRTENRCPMCLRQHTNSDDVVRYTGPHSIVESDHFPFHEHCMRNTTLHCPHMMQYHPEFKTFAMGEETPNFERGKYGDLRINAERQSRWMREAEIDLI